MLLVTTKGHQQDKENKNNQENDSPTSKTTKSSVHMFSPHFARNILPIYSVTNELERYKFLKQNTDLHY